MQDDETVNKIQASILRRLIQEESLRFSELNVDNLPSDQFSYHLRQLIKRDIISKAEDGRYNLSNQGKGRAIMLSSRRDSFIAQGFLAVRVCLSKAEDDKEYFLLQERTLVPYRGTYGTPGDKIFFGEDVADTAVRAMQEQTGLTCDVSLRGVRHVKDVFEGKTMQDKFFFVFKATNPRGELRPSGPTGKNVWLTVDELRASGKSVQGGFEIIEISKLEQLDFSEVTYNVSSY
jgi:ADP-ribose pyrophosphatase YjhB (NUDIX family)